jgi:hypothetical protein
LFDKNGIKRSSTKNNRSFDELWRAAEAESRGATGFEGAQFHHVKAA